jgi:hypothetical protein
VCIKLLGVLDVYAAQMYNNLTLEVLLHAGNTDHCFGKRKQLIDVVAVKSPPPSPACKHIPYEVVSIPV